ncbi:hypothetical protein BJ742DRAFT_888148 [Cladochytrium replicatum]|nr:hypothetical protein BJ742DRAFT_888148 [Cladochytrium replicatum]
MDFNIRGSITAFSAAGSLVGVSLMLDIICMLAIWRTRESQLEQTTTFLGQLLPPLRRAFSGKFERFLCILAAILRSVIWIFSYILPSALIEPMPAGTIAVSCSYASPFSLLPPLTTVTLIFGARMPLWDDWITLVTFALPVIGYVKNPDSVLTMVTERKNFESNRFVDYVYYLPVPFATVACLSCSLVVRWCRPKEYSRFGVRAISWLATAVFLLLCAMMFWTYFERKVTCFNDPVRSKGLSNLVGIGCEILMWVLLLLKSARWEPNPILKKAANQRQQSEGQEFRSRFPSNAHVSGLATVVTDDQAGPGKVAQAREVPVQSVRSKTKVLRKLQYFLWIFFPPAISGAIVATFYCLDYFTSGLLESDRPLRVEISLLSSLFAFLIAATLSSGCSRLLKASTLDSQATLEDFAQLSLAISGRAAALRLKKSQRLALFISIAFMSINPIVSALFQSSFTSGDQIFHSTQKTTLPAVTAYASLVGDTSQQGYQIWQGSCSVLNGTSPPESNAQCKIPLWTLKDDKICNSLLKESVKETNNNIVSGFGSGRCKFSGALLATFDAQVTIRDRNYSAKAMAFAELRSNSVMYFRDLNVTLEERLYCTSNPESCMSRSAEQSTITLSMTGQTPFQIQLNKTGSIGLLLWFATAIIAFVWPFYMIFDVDTEIVNGSRAITALRIYDAASLNATHNVRKGHKIRICRVNETESISIAP